MGSGSGFFEKSLQQQNIKITGIDPLKMKDWSTECKWGLTPKYDYVKNAIKKRNQFNWTKFNINCSLYIH